MIKQGDYLEKIKNCPSLTAFVFASFLTIAEAFFFHQNYTDFFRSFSLWTFEDARAFFFVCFGFAALFFFVRSMLVSSFRWQCVYFAVFFLALSVGYGFHGALGRFALPTDAENALYASDSSDKFGAVTLFFSWLAIIPVLLFRLLFPLALPNAKHGAKLFVTNLLILLIGFATLANFYRPQLPVNSFAAFFDTLAASALYFGEKKFALSERRQVAAIKTKTPRGNIVFIVDESVRGDHLSVNGYARQTTPTLNRLAEKNLLHNWGTAVSGATESVGSNRLLLTGITDLPDRTNDLRRAPTIFQYARAAGYKTFYFDAQSYSDWIGDEKDRQEFGQIFTERDFPSDTAPHDLDRAFAAKIREIVSTSQGNFIWVNKRGAHFRYEKNYPADKIVWSANDAQTDSTEKNELSQQSLIDNYDNAILYNSESFFQTLVGDRLPAQTTYIYTSDHGQTLLPDRATHAGDSKPEALVPILMFGDDERLQNADTKFAAAHSNLFATMLDLMNYPPELRAEKYAVSLLAAKVGDSKPRTYFVGNPSGAFGGKKMIFDEN
jgi:glucan phosphoethanolaminetransferase (alkaline phosphatase superfamily)